MKIAISAVLALCASLSAGDSAHRIKANEVHPDGSTSTSFGSCAVVDCSEFKATKKQYILTAAHVVESRSRRVSVELTENVWIDCVPIHIDRENDIALLRASREFESCSKLAPSDVVTVSGSPASRVVDSHGATIQGFTIHTTGMTHGMSGSPVFNARNEISGIIVAGIADDKGNMRSDLGIAVSANNIRRLLASLKFEKEN